MLFWWRLFSSQTFAELVLTSQEEEEHPQADRITLGQKGPLEGESDIHPSSQTRFIMAEERTQKDKVMPHKNNTAAWLSLHRKS